MAAKAWFSTTHWSVVLRAGSPGEAESRDALATLCQAYWTPVFSYIRQRGYDPESARDLTQGFFVAVLERGGMSQARQERGRFRSFLQASVKNFLADERDRQRALKRGGEEPPISIDAETWEAVLAQEPATDKTPEAIFEQRWAMALIESATAELADDMERAGSGERFRKLSPYLVRDADPPYRILGEELGMSEPTVRVALHRLRHRFGAKLREHVAGTVDDPAKTEEELRYLIQAVGD